MEITGESGQSGEKVGFLPNHEKAVFLPHCLRHKKCPAKSSSHGIECECCGLCGIGSFKSLATRQGYSVYIVPGGSMVEKILKEKKFAAVVGVACSRELKLAYKIINGIGVKSVAVPLSKDGCISTDVDWEKVREACGI